MMRIAVAVTAGLITLTAAVSFAQAPPPKVFDDEGLLRKYVWSTLGTEGALHATLWSAFEQWRVAPPEWSKDAGGFAQRWGSEYAGSAIGSTTKYAVARMFHHDPSFTRC